MKDKILAKHGEQIKIGTKTEVLWTKVRDECIILIQEKKNSIIINEALLDIAKLRILGEQKR